jgi:polar amino acid transport system substrate-binding protein
MGKTLRVIIICVALCSSGPTTLSFSAVNEITVGVSTGYPPYYYEYDGELVGVCIDLVNKVAQMLNLKITYKQYPWKRLLFNAQQGHVDAIMPLFRTEERDKYLYFDNLDLVEEENSLFTWKDNELHYDGSFENIQSYKIGVVTGYSYGEKFDRFSHFNKVTTQNDKHLVKMFKHKRFDVGIGNRDVVMFNAKNENIADQIQFLEPYITKSPLYIAFSKARGLGDLSRKFSAALQRFKLTEEYQTILEKNGMAK